MQLAFALKVRCPNQYILIISITFYCLSVFNSLKKRAILTQSFCLTAAARAHYVVQHNEATLFDVSSGVYYFHLALAHQGKDDRDAALAALEKAEELKFTGEKIDGIDREKYLKLKRWLRL